LSTIQRSEPEGSLQLPFRLVQEVCLCSLSLSQVDMVFLNLLMTSSLTSVQTSVVSSSETTPTYWSSDVSDLNLVFLNPVPNHSFVSLETKSQSLLI
jgi:hypothetical protein